MLIFDSKSSKKMLLMKNLLTILMIIFGVQLATAQYIVVGQDTLFGNEWINFDQTYLKIKVAEDGIYRVSQQKLVESNVPLGQVLGENFQLWHNGEQVPIWTTTSGVMGSSDYIEFFGRKNTSELDRYLFENPDLMMMNPLYSLVTDTAAYFLTWVNTSGNLRYENIANQLSNLPSSEEYYTAELLLNSFARARKEADASGISLSNYSMAEGYSTDFAVTSNFTISPTAVFSGGPDAILNLRFTGNAGNHEQVISVNSNVVLTSTFSENEVQQEAITIPVSQLTGNMAIKFEGIASVNDRNRVSNIILEYPRKFDFENKKAFKFNIESSNIVKYVEVLNFNFSNGEPILYDITNGLRLQGVVEGNIVKFAIPASTTKREMMLVNSNDGVRQVNTITTTTFVNYGAIDHDFIIVSSSRLNNNSSGSNPVQEYANYRASSNGGGYNPIVVNVEELYDQFSWGIERHPFSLRNFAHYVKKNWSGPEYFFIIGKGLEYPLVRTSSALSAAYNSGFVIPTYSFPGSDNQLLAGRDGFTPIIPIGRLAAQNANDIEVYLDKVIEFESNKRLPQTIADKAWMKKGLHLGGGAGDSPGEQALIRAYLENLADTLAKGKMGADVTGFYKTTTDPIQQSQTDGVFEIINTGLSIITFFGHSAPGVFDFSIDFPENWKNKGKYPLMLSLGCYAGNIHLQGKGLGEQFLFLKDAGSILFCATAGQGYANSLNDFAKVIYGELGGGLYGEGFGKILQKTIKHFDDGNFGVNLIRHQFNLLGDPSINVNPASGPDYLIDPATVKLHPEQIVIGLDSFTVSFDVVNIGQNVGDSIVLKLEHQLPSNTRTTVVDKMLPSTNFRQNYNFTLPVPGKQSVGLNQLFGKIDATDRVAELPAPVAEMNNEIVTANGQAGTIFFIRDNSAVPAFPPDFGMVGPGEITLKAYTTDPLAPTRNYILQFDSTELFNSPLLQETAINQSGGILEWKPTLALQDETVYYWRVSPDSTSAEDGFNWNSSSFLYKSNGLSGWNQSHFYQLKKNEFVNMELEGHENLQYLQNLKEFRLRNAPYSVFISQLIVNNTIRGYNWGNVPAGIYVIWIDSVFLEPRWNFYPGNGPTSYGLVHPWGIDTHTFMFDSNESGRKDAMTFLRDVIPNGDYVILFTVQNSPTNDFHPEQWSADSIQLGYNLFSVLEEDGGAQLVRNLETLGSLPYSIAYRKGMGLLGEEIASSSDEIIEMVLNLEGNWDRGRLNTPYIGPSTSWGELNWEYSAISNPETDTISVNLYGAKIIGGEKQLLMENITSRTTDLSAISSFDFPYLSLSLNSRDSIYRTSPNLDYWRVTYQGVPEFTFNAQNAFELLSDTVQAGQQVKLRYAIENMALEDGDSLLVSYSILDSENSPTFVTDRLPIIQGAQTKIAEMTLDTRLTKGRQNLTIELNPNDDQPELIKANNFLQTSFYVVNDLRNPLLDVTFDGIQILDGELVSAAPHIRISMKDENQFLLLDDTSRFKLFLLYPDSTQPMGIWFNSPYVRFQPAITGSNNRASIDLEPIFTSDGIYTLIVQGRDISGNAAGDFDFKRSFEVVTKSSISNFVNYPNPFTTATRFLYTMTGTAPPARYRMQIMTVSGRVVREVEQAELGELKVGTHLTDFVWDGKDEFGDQLANGVYLYRLVVEDVDGKDWEKYDTGTDKYFKAGYGKMVLVR